MHLPAADCKTDPLFIPPFGSSSIPLHQRMEHDTTFALLQCKCFMGWHLATSAISVSSSMTQTGSNSNGLVMPPPHRPSQALPVQHMAPAAGHCGRGAVCRMRGMVVFPACHSCDMEHQLVSMPRSILLLFVTELLNLHSSFSPPPTKIYLSPVVASRSLYRETRGEGDGGRVAEAALEPRE